MYAPARRELLDVAMPDGVRLATSVSLPRPDFHGPALLLRSPYPFLSFAEATLGLDLGEVLANGYAVVRQDVRGRGGSAGAFGFLAQEGADGRATLAWTTVQPWCDGRIATVGGSYMGRVQLLAGDAGSPAPAAVIPALAGLESATTWWPGGVRALALARTWMAELADAEPRTLTTPELAAVRRLLAQDDPRAVLAAAFEPGHPAHRLMAPIVPSLRDDPAERERLLAQAPRVPSLHITGWYDTTVAATIDAWRRARERTAHHHLIVGPWSHSDFGGELQGRRHASGDAAEWGLALRQLDFLAHAVRGEGAPPPPAQVYVTGEDRWRSCADWPPATSAKTLFLTAAADGGLAAEPPAAAALTLNSGAADPVPTLGGPSGFEEAPGAPARCGPADLASLAAREDVLALRSEPLPRALELAGRAALTLVAQSDPAPGGLVAKLAQTDADGTLRALCDGVRAVRADDGGGDGGPFELRIELSPVHHRLRPGQRLVLLLAASEFPRYELGLDADRAIRIRLGGARPARLELPVVA